MKGKDGLLSKRVTLSPQILRIWQTTMRPDPSPVQAIAAVCIALALHATLYTLSSRLKSASSESSRKQESVSVKIAPPKTGPQTRSSPKEAKVESERKSQRQQSPKILTSAQNAAESRESPVVVAPLQEAMVPSSSPPPSRKPALLEERQSPLLPSSGSSFMERQRKLGEVMGAGAVAGDLEIPDVLSEEQPNSPVRRTEYTFAGYFDSLSRRFVEAWGGVRTLPPHARFDGKLGEFIEYDVVINRDGSLRKIINFTAKKQPFRDFSAVDELVTEVFQAMFPFQPIPERIQNDPLVIRKRIQFVGFKYTLY